MSGIEVGFAVIGAVAALISAYKDGDKIWKRIKEKRARKLGHEPPSTGLEKALRRGHEEIGSLAEEYPQAQLDGNVPLSLYKTSWLTPNSSRCQRAERPYPRATRKSSGTACRRRPR